MRFQNLARHPDIGANSYLIEFGETRFVLDSGTHPKHSGKASLPLFESIQESAIDAIFVSHPHLDHIGSLPCLFQRHPEAVVVMTEGSRQAGRALLHNSVNVMTALRTELDEPMYPLYSHRDVDDQYRNWMVKPLRTPFNFGEVDRVTCEFFHAGHVLGAVGICFTHEGRKSFYTGDVHFEDQTMTRGAAFPAEGIDDLIIESTRGDSERAADYSREREKQRLGEVIDETIAGGGAVLIPVFAFGKSQEVAMMMKELMDEGRIPRSPVHIGGLSSKMTAISDEYTECPERLHQDFRLLREFPELRVMAKGKSEPEYRPGHIYALSSGMMSENTVSNRFASRILPSRRDTLVFVGYADPETPAGIIQQSQPGERIVLNSKSGKGYELNCRVERFDFSGHACRDSLVDYAVTLAPERVILVHGDPAAKGWLQQEIRKKLPEAEVLIPAPGEVIG